MTDLRSPSRNLTPSVSKLDVSRFFSAMKSAVAISGYSAAVDLHLQIEDRLFALAQVGPEDVVFAQPVELPLCDADVVLQVDGEERRWRVRLPAGASASTPLTPIVRLAD